MAPQEDPSHMKKKMDLIKNKQTKPPKKISFNLKNHLIQIKDSFKDFFSLFKVMAS